MCGLILFLFDSMENDGFSSGTHLMGRESSREPREAKPALADTTSLPPPPLDETTSSPSSSSSSLRLPSEEASDDSSGLSDPTPLFPDPLRNPPLSLWPEKRPTTTPPPTSSSLCLSCVIPPTYAGIEDTSTITSMAAAAALRLCSSSSSSSSSSSPSLGLPNQGRCHQSREKHRARKGAHV